jgi:hypothetical protein
MIKKLLKTDLVQSCPFVQAFSSWGEFFGFALVLALLSVYIYGGMGILFTVPFAPIIVFTLSIVAIWYAVVFNAPSE